MFNIASLLNKSLTHFIDYDSTGMLELPTEGTPWIKISDNSSLKIYINGLLLCYPPNIAQAIVITLGAHWVFNVHFQKKIKSYLEILTKMLHISNGHLSEDKQTTHLTR